MSPTPLARGERCHAGSAQKGWRMGLRLKFNLVLVLVFAVGLALSGVLSRRILEENAQDEVVRNAELMMGSALAVRTYTNRQITPQLEIQLMRTFLPQAIREHAAT